MPCYANRTQNSLDFVESNYGIRRETTDFNFVVISSPIK
ncbi:hypothetical protein C942_02493 [Photobacterium marinum]|uniref:Uncharacterized protein n=1 Tax=Photobacterium marinum TaxID=1056511 RepID=L8JA86_9GAMM|nr:hypothetical protein C942_02493 [Photobacterium marinum]